MKGVGPVVTFQDMVMQAGNGVLPHAGVNSSEIGDKANPVARTTLWKQVLTKRHLF